MGGLDVIVEPEDPADVPEAEPFSTSELSPSDHLTDFRQEYEIKRLEQKLLQLRAQVKQDADRHTLRKRYSIALFVLALLWILTVWLFVALQGLGSVPWFSHWKFRLSDAVLIAYITSTTASILGLYGIAAYWLFGDTKRKPPPKKSSPKTPE